MVIRKEFCQSPDFPISFAHDGFSHGSELVQQFEGFIGSFERGEVCVCRDVGIRSRFWRLLWLLILRWFRKEAHLGLRRRREGRRGWTFGFLKVTVSREKCWTRGLDVAFGKKFRRPIGRISPSLAQQLIRNPVSRCTSATIKRLFRCCFKEYLFHSLIFLISSRINEWVQ